jgi:two-component system, sensor histidine kinase and response regulator
VESTSVLPRAPSAPSKILLVDDRPENLLAFEELLAQPDRQLFRASSGNEALRLVLKHDFAVVLLDVEMPFMDGYETAQLMRSHQRTQRVPIIFVTAGHQSDQRMFRGYEVGAVDFLYKPVNPTVLRSKVHVFVELERNTLRLQWLNDQLVRAEAALQEKVVDLETLNRTLFHDLRAPLRSIHGYSQVLADSLRGKLEPESEQHLSRVTAAAGRMQRMLDDLYRLLQVGGAGTSLPLDVVDSDAVLSEVLEDLRADIDRAGGEVTREPLPPVRANGTLLRQIFQNLIDNALKFRGPEAPRIHVAGDEGPDGVALSVRDNGVGIAPEHHQKIFGVFQRLVGQSVPGSGVGLSLCKRAVERLGGTLRVESAPGQGSTFVFTLPRA